MVLSMLSREITRCNTLQRTKRSDVVERQRSECIEWGLCRTSVRRSKGGQESNVLPVKPAASEIRVPRGLSAQSQYRTCCFWTSGPSVGVDA